MNKVMGGNIRHLPLRFGFVGLEHDDYGCPPRLQEDDLQWLVVGCSFSQRRIDHSGMEIGNIVSHPNDNWVTSVMTVLQFMGWLLLGT